jgi:hypothetical protein
MLVGRKAAEAACKDVLPLVDRAFDRPGGPAAAVLKERFCQGCDIAAECLLEAARGGRHEFGVWGGTSPHWRTRNGAVPAPAYVRERALAANAKKPDAA